MSTPLRVLIVEDSENDALLAVSQLELDSASVKIVRRQRRGYHEEAFVRETPATWHA
jgi:hypothetical protein